MRLSGPDEVLFAYIEAKARTGSPPSLHPVQEEGWRFAPSCRRRCPDGVRTYRADSELGRGVWICSRCAAPWPMSKGAILRGEIQAGRSGAHEERLDRVAEMGRALSRLDHWETRIYIELYLWTGLSYERTAREANRRWSPRSRQWTTWRVRQIVARARRKLEEELGIVPNLARRPPTRIR